MAKRQRPEVSSQRSEARVSWQKSVVGDHASEPRVSRFQKMDCAAPATFTHTRGIRSYAPPLPAKRGIGGRPKERGSLAFSHRATPLRPPIQLAEGVEFLEKYAPLDHLESSIWRRGSLDQLEAYRAGGAHLGNEGRWTRPTPDSESRASRNTFPSRSLGTRRNDLVQVLRAA